MMKLGFEETQATYSSGSQNARAWTERWVKDQLFCPNCGNSNLHQFPVNQPVADFVCPLCNEEFELKSQKSAFGKRIVDGAFRTMCERLAASNNPSLLLLNYDLTKLSVRNALVIPKHFFVREIIEERKPLAPTARRAGWIGCNILLGQIPAAGKICIVQNGQARPRDAVLADWKRTLFLRRQNNEARGWLLEIMRCVDEIGRPEFDLQDVYGFESKLGDLYPQNRHVRQKIRQQLQVLRDHGYLDFLGSGHYRLRARR
jgi:type II restriction enzyme